MGTYIFSWDRLARHLLKKIENVILRPNLTIPENGPVQRPRIGNDSRGVFSDIAVIRQGPGRIPVADDLRRRIFSLGADSTRGQGWQGELVPPTDVDGGVGEVEPFDVIQYVLLL
jgi:hypothetical protein